MTMTATEDIRQPLLTAIEDLQSRPPTPAVRIALAEAEFRLAVAADTEPAEALTRLDTAVHHDPFCPKLFLHRGRLYHQSGRPSAALPEYRHVIRLAPGSRRAYLLLALALLDLGQATRTLGDLVLAALSSDDPADLRAAVAEVDLWLAVQADPAADGARKRRPPAAKPSGRGGPDVWRVALYEQVTRGKPQPGQLSALLETGRVRMADAGEIAEYATACVLLLASGQPPHKVREFAKPVLAEHEDHPAVALLDAALRLSQAPDPAAFAELATGLVERDVLPIELMCSLHLTRYGSEQPGSAADALARLARYPVSIHETECFAELKLAVLDGYARKACAAGQFAEARLLWQEAGLIDQFRVPVAFNLALLAARTKSISDYDAAWARLSELLYLHAAGVGDVQLLLPDRRTLHLALAQQAQSRHCPSSDSSQLPNPAEIAAWLADTDALTEWLDQWDLYYVNARLGFRSPVHLLGASSGTDAKDLAVAKGVFVEHLGIALDGRDWAGVCVFAGLAAGQAEQAYRAIINNEIRDQYYERERAAALDLAEAALNRGLTLRRMMIALLDRRSADQLRLGYELARRQLALPWHVLRPICVERGLIGGDVDPVALFQDDLVNLAMLWDPTDVGSADELADRLSTVDDCITLLPHHLALRLLRCLALRAMNRDPDAYAAALEALAGEAFDDETREPLVENLVDMIDDIGWQALPESVRSGIDPAGAQEAATALRRALRRFPRCGVLRRELAKLLAARDSGGTGEAIALLSEGLESALSPLQREEFARRLAAIRSAAATAPIRESIRQLVQTAQDTARAAVKEYTKNPGNQTKLHARRALHHAIEQLAQAQRLAEQPQVGADRAQLAGVLGWLRQLLAEVDDAESDDGKR